MRNILSLFVRVPAFFFLFCQLSAPAQNITTAKEEIPVTVKISNAKKEPLAFATVTVTNRHDSLQSFRKLADSTGVARFDLLKGGQYTISASAVNYIVTEKGITVTQNQSFFSLVAETKSKTLSNVVIKAIKPIMRQEDDKLIVEPQNLVAASTSGYEVIEKTPGLFVDQDGNIYISSLTPATVQINGREMKMSAADMASMLKSLPPDAISRIEILRTPSAKYDASGGGGIVNVVLKKGVKLGMTGSVNGGIQQGIYGNQFIGFNLNNNDGKKSSFINLNYSRRNSFETIVTDRLFAPDSVLSQNAHTRYPASVYFAGMGLARSVNKWEFDLGSSMSLNDFNNHTQNQSMIRKLSSSQTLTDNLNQVNNNGYSLNYRVGLEAGKKLDSTGSEWDNDFFYNYSQNKSDQVYTTRFTIPVIPDLGGDGNMNNRRNLFSLKSDLKLKMKKKFTLETGAKSSLLGYKNVTGYFKESGGIREKDYGRTNTFHYAENINAFYLQGSQTLKKDIVIKTGLRIENTNMKGRQIIPADTNFTIHRTDMFPYIYISKNLMKIAGYDLRAYLVYRRTISRPVYEQLNPFPRYIDPYLSEAGNPTLRPQFTTNYEANVSVDERPILAIGVNKTKDIFTNVVYQSDTSQRQATRTYDNLGSNKEFYLRGMGALPPGGKYFFVIGAQYNHNFYQGLYENKPLSYKKGTWTIFTYQTLKLDKRSTITLNGFVRFRGQQQFYELSSFGALNTSINRQFFRQKLILTLSLSDIFLTNRNDFTIKQGSVNASGYRHSDTRRFGINIRYNFGIRKKEDNNNLFNVESPEKTN